MELLKKMQNANPHIRKSKEEGISSALVAVDYIIQALEEYPDSLEDREWWGWVKNNLLDL
jgi:hypothetical protein